MSLSHLFDDLPDPRAANSVHKLGDVLVIMIAAVMCGRKTATDIALFAELRRTALAPLVRYDRAPSHDTISRLLRVLDAEAFGQVLARFATAFARACEAQGLSEAGHVAIDGKALRRACDAAQQTTPPMTLSAFASGVGLTLGVRPGPGAAGFDEGKRAVELVDLLDLAGKIVTADALHCNRAMAGALAGQGARYILSLRRNRAAWHDDAVAAFAAATPLCALTEHRAHGRHERREAAVIAAATPQAPGHTAYGRIVSHRNGAPPVTRYFLLSEAFTPDVFLDLVRKHWSIETALHWTLDVHLAEDQNRGRKDHSPANIATLNPILRRAQLFLYL